MIIDGNHLLKDDNKDRSKHSEMVLDANYFPQLHRSDLREKTKNLIKPIHGIEARG